MPKTAQKLTLPRILQDPAKSVGRLCAQPRSAQKCPRKHRNSPCHGFCKILQNLWGASVRSLGCPKLPETAQKPTLPQILHDSAKSVGRLRAQPRSAQK